MDDTPIADPTANEGETAEIAPATDTIDDGAAAKDEAAPKEEDPATVADMMEDAAGAEGAPAPTADGEKEASEAKVEGSAEGEKAETATETTTPAKETKKRVRRVGRTPTRKIPKLEEKIATPLAATEGGDNNNAETGAVEAATATDGAAPEGTAPMEIVAQPPASQGVLSKHDEKWHAMFQKLMEYKERNKHTLVPQCYTEDPRLGRWVHYQRVEYWIFQQKGTAKITEERIARLDHIGFEWDPQKAQWEKMFAKLMEFKKEFSHCRVPKGYEKDYELANWVRNQRLEQANLSKEGKKSRMTPERFKLLDELGFKWSSPTPARARRNKSTPKKGEEQKAASTNGAASEVKVENGAPADAAEDSKAADPAQAEAMTAATDAVGDLPAVEAGVSEEKADASTEVPLETENLVTV